MAKELKVGVHKGDGPPPGYRWNVLMIDFVYDEVMKFLDEAQYAHLAHQFQELGLQLDPRSCQTISVKRIEDFYELRDKGGILGGLNVRVFYHVDDGPARSIVVLGAIVKQNDGATLNADKIRMRRRQRKYKAGEYGTADINERRVGAGRNVGG